LFQVKKPSTTGVRSGLVISKCLFLISQHIYSIYGIEMGPSGLVLYKIVEKISFANWRDYASKVLL